MISVFGRLVQRLPRWIYAPTCLHLRHRYTQKLTVFDAPSKNVCSNCSGWEWVNLLTGYPLAPFRASLHAFFLSKFHLFLSSLCLLCHFMLLQYSLFLSFYHLHCFSVLPFSFLLLPPSFPLILSPFYHVPTPSFFCLLFLSPHTLNLHILSFLFPPSFSLLVSSTPSTSIPILDVLPGLGSWRLSPWILGCCRGL